MRASPGPGNELALDHLGKRMREIEDERQRLLGQISMSSMAMVENYHMMRSALGGQSNIDPVMMPYSGLPGGALQPGNAGGAP